MSNYSTLTIDVDDNVAIVSFNRPDNLNALNRQLRMELIDAINEVNANSAIRVGVLTGKGRSFSAGADLAEELDNSLDTMQMITQEYKPSLLSICQAPIPWLSAVNGAAAGIGSAYAMTCDLSVMADNAYLYQAFAAIGLVPDGGATWHLARTVGRQRAYEFIVGGEKVSAQKCLSMGLCNRIAPAEQLLETALDWAQDLARRAPLSLRYAKEQLNVAMAASLYDSIDYEAKMQGICVASEDAAEGIAAFKEKRLPVWRGK